MIPFKLHSLIPFVRLFPQNLFFFLDEGDYVCQEYPPTNPTVEYLICDLIRPYNQKN
jgi:hypothetical protein